MEGLRGSCFEENVMPDEATNASSHVVQEASESTSAGAVNFGGAVMNLALSNAVATQAAMMNNLVRQDRVSEAVSGTLADRVMNSQPSELAGENKILYSTPPTGFTGVGHYPAEPATGSRT